MHERPTRLTVHLGAEQVAALKEMASRNGLSASALAQLAVGFLLANPALFLPPVLSQTRQNAEPQPAGASA